MQPFTHAATGCFQAGAYGRGSQRGHSRRGGCNGHGGGQNKRTPFANYQQRQQRGCGCRAGAFIPQAPTALVLQSRTVATPFSNPTRMFANLNVCYSCGFDIKEGNTPAMCPRDWCKPITTRDSHALMRRSTSTKDGIRAQRGCTKRSFRGFVGVGWRSL